MPLHFSRTICFDRSVDEATFTWSQIINEICKRVLVHLSHGQGDANLSPTEGADLLAATIDASKTYAETAMLRDMPLSSEMTAFLSGSPSWVASLGQSDLEDFCNHVGLLGPVGSHPSCLTRLNLGRIEGRPAVYLESAVERVIYVAFGRATGLGAEKIKGALKANIDWMGLAFCGDDRIFRYAVTKPLLGLLNCNQVDWDAALEIYYELSGYQNHRLGVLTPVLQRKMLDLYGRMPEKPNPAKRRKGAIPVYAGINRLAARDFFLFHHYLSDGIRADSYLADFKTADIQRAKMVLAALKRVAAAERGQETRTDLDLLETYHRTDYSVIVEPITCHSHDKEDGGSHFIYKYSFGPRDAGLTLLQQASSHLLWIIKAENGGKRFWLRRCKKIRREKRCPRYFFPFDSSEFCDLCRRRKLP